MPDLPVGSICIVLNARGDGTFHWEIVVPYDKKNAMVLHASNLQGGWRYETKKENLVTSQALVLVLEIGKTSEINTTEVVHNMLQKIPMKIPEIDIGVEPTFTCRVWVNEAVKVLTKHGVVCCASVAEVEKECKALGGEIEPSIVREPGHFRYTLQNILVQFE